MLNRSLDSLLSNRNESDSTVPDSDRYSSDGGRCPPSWIQEVESEDDAGAADGTIISGHMMHRTGVSHDEASHASANIAVSTPKHERPQHTTSPTRTPMTGGDELRLQMVPSSGSSHRATSNSKRRRSVDLRSTDSPDMFDRRRAPFDSTMECTVDGGSFHNTYFDSNSLSLSRAIDSARSKTDDEYFSRSVNDVNISPQRTSPQHKQRGSPGKSVCFDFSPQEQQQKLPPVYNLMAPWLKDSQREAYLRRLDHDIEESPSSFAGDSVCSSTNWETREENLGTSLGGDNPKEGATGGKLAPSTTRQQADEYNCYSKYSVKHITTVQLLWLYMTYTVKPCVLENK